MEEHIVITAVRTYICIVRMLKKNGFRSISFEMISVLEVIYIRNQMG